MFIFKFNVARDLRLILIIGIETNEESNVCIWKCYLILSCVFFMTYTYDNDTIVVYVVVRESQLFIVETTRAIIFG